MLFTSLDFVYLLFATFVIFYIPFLRAFQSVTLLISSFCFYAYNAPSLLFVLFFSLLVNSLSSYYILYADKYRLLILRLALIINVLTLCFFKYTKLLVSTFLPFEYSESEFVQSIVLPIGISFYTFQGISLILDCYNLRQTSKLKFHWGQSFFKHIVNVSFYISFFPQLIAGPIVKSREFLDQIKVKAFKDINWEYAIKMLILGYFFKMVVADNLKDISIYLEYPSFTIFSSFTLSLLVFSYSIQIFADFAGYSIIAIGLGQFFGYKLPINFSYPYISSTFFEFWKRWHITLYAWFNDYVYTPFVLAFRDFGNKTIIIGLILIFALSGIWHGGSWNFLYWGIFHGLILVVEFLFKRKKRRKNKKRSLLSILFVFLVVNIGYTIFKFENVDELILFYKHFFNNISIKESSLQFEVYILLYSLPVIIYHFYFLYFNEKVNKNIKAVAYAFMLFMIIVNSGFEGEFIYFQF